jgi:hypothetical protein
LDCGCRVHAAKNTTSPKTTGSPHAARPGNPSFLLEPILMLMTVLLSRTGRTTAPSALALRRTPTVVLFFISAH